MGADCCFIGLCTVDHIALVGSRLREDEKIRARAIITDGGGPAATAACAASRLGLKCELLSVLGRDQWLQFSRASLREFGVDCALTRVSESFRTPVSLIFANTATAARTIIWNSGGINSFDFALSAAEKRRIMSARALHFDGHAMKLGTSLAREARKRGLLVSYDCGSAKPGWEKLAAHSGVFIASHKFAAQLGLSPREAVRTLRNRFGFKCAVTCGAQGVWYFDEGQTRPALLPQKKYRALDTTGCGDVLHGAFLAHYLARGGDFAGALEFGQRAAGLKAGVPGGRAGIPAFSKAWRGEKWRTN